MEQSKTMDVRFATIRMLQILKTCYLNLILPGIILQLRSKITPCAWSVTKVPCTKMLKLQNQPDSGMEKQICISCM